MEESCCTAKPPASAPSAAAPPLGAFDELHKKTSDVFPMCFEGAKIMVQKGLSSHFQINHTLSMSSMNNGYRFGAVYAGSSQKSDSEAFPVLIGDTNALGQTQGTLIHQFMHKYRIRLTAQTRLDSIDGGVTLERRGTHNTIALSVNSPNIIRDTGIAAFSYMQRVTKNIDAGVEYVSIHSPQIPGGSMNVTSFGLRYSADFFTAAATAGKDTSHFSYYHKQAENLEFGVEFQMNRLHKDSVATLAYHASLPEEGVSMRASVDTNWTVGGVLEKRLSQALPFTFALSGLVNHTENKAKFGVGLIIG